MEQLNSQSKSVSYYDELVDYDASDGQALKSEKSVPSPSEKQKNASKGPVLKGEKSDSPSRKQ
ncbi:hypothetical protein Tco_1381404, partial [Tanacetum coccineum]